MFVIEFEKHFLIVYSYHIYLIESTVLILVLLNYIFFKHSFTQIENIT